MEYKSVSADVKGFEHFDYRTSFIVSSAEVMLHNMNNDFLDIAARCREGFIAPCPDRRFYAGRFNPPLTESEVLEMKAHHIQTDLFDLWQCLHAQPRGKRGFLRVDGSASFFYIQGAWWEAFMRVQVCWITNKGWQIEAHSIEPEYKIGKDILVVFGT